MFLLFAGALVCIQLGFTNLVLAVIVDKAAEARECDKEAKLQLLRAQQEESLQDWQNMMVDMDGNGTVTLEELLDGFELDEMKHRMQTMSVDENDMMTLFKLMDCDD